MNFDGFKRKMLSEFGEREGDTTNG